MMKRKILSVILSSMFLISFLAFDAFAEESFSGGVGSENDPYLVSSASDLWEISSRTAGGTSFSGQYFKMTKDIELPFDWTPIGQNRKLFSGVFDGGGHTVTVPEGSSSPLFGYLNNAEIKNLNIYGKKISSYGLVKNYSTNQSFILDNITIKSGTHTLFSGLVGGYGNKSVTIRNCVAEKGVVIGDDGTYPDWAELADADVDYPWVATFKAKDMIGSFAGAFNGTIENCVSYAKVCGGDYVGGIAGFKGQAMREFKVKNCRFDGEIIGKSYVGGIVGSGYITASSPNCPGVTIENCTASAVVRGESCVGGIFGGEGGIVQAWEKGKGLISGNIFTGKVLGESKVGGIIGYMNSLNRYTIVENNGFSCGCGTDRGIGEVSIVDTYFESPCVVAGVNYINTANGVSGCPSVQYCSWKPQHNRTDDPLGKDSDLLCRIIHNYELETAGEQYLKSGLHGAKGSVYYKSCKCGAHGTETFTLWNTGYSAGGQEENYQDKSPKTGEALCLLLYVLAVLMIFAALISVRGRKCI